MRDSFKNNGYAYYTVPGVFFAIQLVVLHTAPLGLKSSSGQEGCSPVHTSARSQTPAAGRQTVPAAANASAGHCRLAPSQTSGASTPVSHLSSPPLHQSLSGEFRALTPSVKTRVLSLSLGTRTLRLSLGAPPLSLPVGTRVLSLCSNLILSQEPPSPNAGGHFRHPIPGLSDGRHPWTPWRSAPAVVLARGSNLGLDASETSGGGPQRIHSAGGDGPSRAVPYETAPADSFRRGGRAVKGRPI
jgi:hypothetical protein